MSGERTAMLSSQSIIFTLHLNTLVYLSVRVPPRLRQLIALPTMGCVFLSLLDFVHVLDLVFFACVEWDLNFFFCQLLDWDLTFWFNAFLTCHGCDLCVLIILPMLQSPTESYLKTNRNSFNILDGVLTADKALWVERWVLSHRWE